jgi:hypothetical protein
VLAKVVTLAEIRRSWKLIDLVDAHIALDLQEDIERLVHAGTP